MEMVTLYSWSPEASAVTNAHGQADISAFKGSEKIFFPSAGLLKSGFAMNEISSRKRRLVRCFSSAVESFVRSSTRPFASRFASSNSFIFSHEGARARNLRGAGSFVAFSAAELSTSVFIARFSECFGRVVNVLFVQNVQLVYRGLRPPTIDGCGKRWEFRKTA